MAKASTDADGVDHFPARTGGPSFATVCAADGEDWPCDAADKLGAKRIKPAAGTFDPSEPGETIEGNAASSIILPGAVSADDAIAAGVSRDAADTVATTTTGAEPASDPE